MMMGGFKYCNGRPCKFHISEEEVSQGYLHEWLFDRYSHSTFGLIEDLNGFMHRVDYTDIQLLPWDTIFVKEERTDEP